MNIVFAICYLILILNLLMMKCNDIFTKDAISGQILLLPLIEGLERVKVSLEIINRRYLHQINDLKNVVSACHEGFVTPAESAQCNDSVCEEILFYSNETLAKYAMFNDKLLMKLSEINKNHTPSLEVVLKTIDLQKYWKNLVCKTITISTDNLLSSIEDKVKDFEKNLNEFESVGEKLILQQTSLNIRNENLMKNLLEIRVKLVENKLKFEKFEKELPDMNNFSNKIRNSANWKLWRHRNLPRQ